MSSQNRILLASEYFYPHWTGIAKTFYYAARQLIERGYGVTVLTTQYDASSPLEEQFDGMRIVRAPYQFRISRTHYSLRILWTFISMLPSYDIVVINSPNSNILFFALFSKLFKKRCIILHQGDLKLPRLTGNIFQHRLLEFIFDALTIPSFFFADVASSFTKDYARHSRVMKYSLHKFKPYVPSYKMSDKNPSANFEKKMADLHKNHVLVGIAGRFVEEKAYDVLLKAIPLVLEKVPNAHFVFAGKTDIDYEPFYQYVAELIDKNKQHLTFLGLLDEGNYRYFFESLDVFVISSRSECLAITQIEAGLQGVPIVCTDVPGARMLVKETGFGEIVPPENPQALADGIIHIIKNRSSYAKNHENIKKFLKKYEEFPI